ncbi:MAG TPA: hypothetical protein VFZ34_26435 [Blastocatellia bacterium]|nr:hypothetical protein [Blastocatellia bacterium]
MFDIPEDKVTITTVRHWLWTADDKSLLIEMMRTAPNGTISSKRMFVRK